MTVVPRPDLDELAQCVGCGLCLPHCPTYRVTADERQSPRGRIALLREWIDSGRASDDSLDAFESCIQCLGCETACPSGVRYGHLITEVRRVTGRARRPSFTLRVGLAIVRHPRILRTATFFLGLGQMARLVPRRIGLPRVRPIPPKLHLERLTPEGTADESSLDGAFFFRGCVMDAWMRDVHVDTVNVLRAAGVVVHEPAGLPTCCGALHEHAGVDDAAREMADRAMRLYEGSAPIVVNSAGCGAMLKEYGHLLGTDVARRFSARVKDVHEFLAEPRRRDRLAANLARKAEVEVVVQDPCHLRHAQRAHLPVRELVSLVADVRELSDDGLCCGAGGSYFMSHPDMANELRSRKIAAIRSVTNAEMESVVVSANPGCSMHLANGGVVAEHPMTFLARHLASHTQKRSSRSRSRRSHQESHES